MSAARIQPISTKTNIHILLEECVLQFPRKFKSSLQTSPNVSPTPVNPSPFPRLLSLVSYGQKKPLVPLRTSGLTETRSPSFCGALHSRLRAVPRSFPLLPHSPKSSSAARQISGLATFQGLLSAIAIILGIAAVSATVATTA